MKNKANLLRYFFAVLFIILSDAGIVGGQELGIQSPSAWPSLVASVKITEPIDFCGEPVDLASQEVRERLEKELLLTIWDRPQVILWIKRSTRYLPIIEKMLSENEMPDDLKYVAIIESALRPHAGSRKGAIGFWQFLKSTGQKYGLRINAEIDERRNIFASTLAAINYFKDLYQMLGSWTLAAAAFNMGEFLRNKIGNLVYVLGHRKSRNKSQKRTKRPYDKAFKYIYVRNA